MRRYVTFIVLTLWAIGALAVDDGYDVYLLLGQSNMAGRGTLEAADTTTAIEGVWLLDSDGVPTRAIAPLNRYSSIRKDIKLQGYSPANEFGRLMHSRTGRKILLVVNAKGGSAISQWQPGDRHGFLNEAVRRARQAMQYGTLKGILWHQGETDIQRHTPDYGGKFATMIGALRDSLDAHDVLVVAGQTGRWGWAPAKDINTFNDSVVPAMCHRVKNCTYVSSHDLGRLFKDKEHDPHFSRKAQIELGRRYADAMTELAEHVYVTRFRNNRRAAISFTFDDGDLDHYLLAAPELEKRGFRGTFWVIGQKVDACNDTVRPRASWSQLREMAGRGHEISNHSWTHGKLVLMKPEEARREIEMNDSAIAANTGVRPVTFCYPYNAAPSWLIEIASEGRVGTRLHQKGIGQANNKSTTESIKAWVDQVVATGDWGVTMTHGIRVGYDNWHTPQDLWDMFDYVKSREDSIWVATFRDIATYRTERDNVAVKATHTATGMTISTSTDLPADLFNAPLTVAVKGDWADKEVSASRMGAYTPLRTDGNLLLLQMQPDDKVEIHIR